MVIGDGLFLNGSSLVGWTFPAARGVIEYMPRFFFDLAYGGDVYHDAKGTYLPKVVRAKDRAFDMVRKMTVDAKGQDDVVCTVRNSNCTQLMQITIQHD
ncbi:MAG: hypothetical protein EOR60_26365 [Mesorhizobium sp.]|nr:MAG: hypothetical protein EOR60_26365 [Mesorhizobium sp.]